MSRLLLRSKFNHLSITSRLSLSVARPAPISIHLVEEEEEVPPSFNATHVFPVERGKVFGERYETIVKLRYGGGSTVWLARDLNVARSEVGLEPSSSTEPYVVLKFDTCDYVNKEAAQHEWQAGRRLRLASANPFHEGTLYLQTFIEGFEVAGSDGVHICLVFEPMRESLSLFQSRLRHKRFPLELMKMYLVCILNGLDYLHSECHVIHTDLTLPSILVTFEDDSVLEEFAQAHSEQPMLQKKRDPSHQPHNQPGLLRVQLPPIVPKIADFSHTQWITDSEPQINPIQPDYYRAPEVILGAGWSYSADIWNLGVLLWNMLEGTGKNLFTQIYSSDGKYMAQNHLAQMIALLGPPPKELLSRELEMRKWNFAPAIENDEEKLCNKAYQFYKGPFFNNEGTFLYPDLVSTTLNLEDTISSLEGENKRAFLDFVVGNMLCWVPERRKTAKELLDHPWLKGPEPQKEAI